MIAHNAKRQDMQAAKAFINPHQAHEFVLFCVVEHKLSPHHPRDAVIDCRVEMLRSCEPWAPHD